jgi:hypothetical protein
VVAQSGCDDGSSAQKYKASSAYQVTGVDNTRLEIYNNGPVTAIFDVCQNFYDFYNDRSNAAKVYTGSCSSSSSDYAGGHAISVVGYGPCQCHEQRIHNDLHLGSCHTL